MGSHHFKMWLIIRGEWGGVFHNGRMEGIKWWCVDATRAFNTTGRLIIIISTC